MPAIFSSPPANRRIIDDADPEELYRLIRQPAVGLVPVKLLKWEWVRERASRLRAATTDKERAALDRAAGDGRLDLRAGLALVVSGQLRV